MTSSGKKTDDGTQHIDADKNTDDPKRYDLGFSTVAPDSNEENTTSEYREVDPSEEESGDSSDWSQPSGWKVAAENRMEGNRSFANPVDEEEDDTSKKDTSGLSRPSGWHNSARGVRSRLKDDVEEFADDYLASEKSINRRNVRSAANNHFGTGHPHDVGELKELLEHLS